jgi:hypothetical protein
MGRTTATRRATPRWTIHSTSNDATLTCTISANSPVPAPLPTARHSPPRPALPRHAPLLPSRQLQQHKAGEAAQPSMKMTSTIRARLAIPETAGWRRAHVPACARWGPLRYLGAQRQGPWAEWGWAGRLPTPDRLLVGDAFPFFPSPAPLLL